MRKQVLIEYIAVACIFAAFCTVFRLLNLIFAPKYALDSTAIVGSFYAMEPNTTDVIFIGSSQMFCGTRPDIISKYGISSCDFGASNQPMEVSGLYAKEALKTQAPKVLMLEIGNLYSVFSNQDAATMSWNYDALRLSIDKISSLHSMLDGDWKETIAYSFPLLKYHSRWDQLEDLDFIWPYSDHLAAKRGFVDFSDAEEVTMAYSETSADGNVLLPEKNVAALREIKKLCASHGIELILYKVPNGVWTRDMLDTAKELATHEGIEYLDCFDFLEQIGLNASTDFRDTHHLNSSGAEKVSHYLGAYLADHIFEERNRE